MSYNETYSFQEYMNMRGRPLSSSVWLYLQPMLFQC